jgi:hypothetical protein
MGNAILDIQEMANMGIPNEQIAKTTKTSLDLVEKIVQDMFEWDRPQYDEEFEDV